MSDIKARYVGPERDGVTLGVRLDDGDIVPLHVPQGGELPAEIDGRGVSSSYRDGLLAQSEQWTHVRRDAKKPAASDKPAQSDKKEEGEK